MITIKATDREFRRYVANIVKVWDAASGEQRTEGRNWYWNAHRTAEHVADGDTRKGAGLIAALSPQTSWWLNIELASDAFENGYATDHLGDAVRKADRILAGEDPSEVLPMQRKTGHFYRSILHPDDPTATCIDRHAHDLMTGKPWGDAERGLSAHGRYALCAQAYWEAAQRLGAIPSVVQAVTWVTWRHGLKSPSARIPDRRF